jgi:hypothetical protein
MSEKSGTATAASHVGHENGADISPPDGGQSQGRKHAPSHRVSASATLLQRSKPSVTVKRLSLKPFCLRVWR